MYGVAETLEAFPVITDRAAGFRFESSSLGLGNTAVGLMADFNKDR